MSVKELQEYTFKSKYSQWLPDKQRRENWGESVDRFCDMFLEKYKDKPQVFRYIETVRKSIRKKSILGSQRGLQFGGKATLKKNLRIYNCLFSYCDRPRFFQEAMYGLMCGCGFGYSVQKHHISKLPPLINPSKGTKTFIIPDSIEGWADAIGVIVNSYFDNCEFPEYSGYKVEFDYSHISPKGTLLSSCYAKAPGPAPLEKAVENVRKVLDTCVMLNGVLTPLQCHDIICYFSDAVVSGGVRRSALIALFSKDDQEMIRAKTGGWLAQNPQRGRANNSVVLLKSELELEEFKDIIKSVREFGEPGFVFVDDLEHGVNPCQPKWAKVLTRDGIREFQDIDVGSEIWSEDGWVKVTKKWSTGQNEVYRYKTTFGTFYGTDSHRLVTSCGKVEAIEAEDIQVLTGEYIPPSISGLSNDYSSIMDGLLLGDGSVHKASNNLIHLYIGQDDFDYFDSEIAHLIKKHRPGIAEAAYEVVGNVITWQDLPRMPERRVPLHYLHNNRQEKFLFLRGLYSANGSVCGNRITLKSASSGLIEDVQCMLSSLGIRSYITINKPTMVEFKNGTYECKQSYDLNITTDREKFVESIGFIQKYKNEKINIVKGKPKSEFSPIISRELVSIEETFDITVDGKSHTYWTNGCNVSNCAEISFFAYDEDGNSGVQGCNLSTINSGKIKNKRDFFRACRDGAIIGTLQAGFTDFPYLGKVSENIFKKEALLGVSMTGIMECPEICLDPEIQRQGAEIVKRINRRIAKLIDINVAARATAIKPEGSASCVLGTSSGIHPHHAKRYIRRVQANRLEEVYQFFKSKNPLACERSVWSENDTDDVISFCIEVKDGAKLKNQISALEMLKSVKLTQTNWVHGGRNLELCSKPWLQHNVSNTITVKDNEWDDVTNYLYENREFFCGISLLSSSGDKDYPQAPFTEVFLSRELINIYGDAALFASGLIEKAKELFEDSLFDACDAILGTKVIGRSKLNFIAKSKKYAEKYLGGDLKRLTYCLKDVDAWKCYIDLKREYQPVDYNELFENVDNTTLFEEVACGNGKCDLV